MLINLKVPLKGVYIFSPIFIGEKTRSIQGHHRRVHLPRGYSRGYLGVWNCLTPKRRREKHKKNTPNLLGWLICDRGIMADL